jgi:hypothetical protein
MRKWLSEWFEYWGVASITSVVAVALIIGGQRIAATGARSEAWPSTTGKVVELKVVAESTSSRSQGGRWFSPGISSTTTSVTYRPVITYEYSVGRQTFRSTNITVAGFDGTSEKKDAQEVVDRYVVGMTVDVYYDPGNPAFSVLEKGRRGSTTLRTVGLLVLVMALMTTAISAWVWRKNRRAAG